MLGPGGSLQGRRGQRLTVARPLSHCLSALGLSVEGLLSRGAIWALPVRAWAVADALSLPRSTWNFTRNFPSSRRPLGLKHTLGRFPGRRTRGPVPSALWPSAHVVCTDTAVSCALASVYSDLPLLSGSCQTSFSQGKDAQGHSQRPCLASAHQADLQVRAPPGGVPRWQPAILGTWSECGGWLVFLFPSSHPGQLLDYAGHIPREPPPSHT